MQSKQNPNLVDEFETAALGDRRLTSRLQKMALAASRAPELSLPRRSLSDGELEATYRFLSNGDVSAEEVAAAHVRCTVERARSHRQVLVLHDTTEFEFGIARHRADDEDLASTGRHGFLAHFSICTSLKGDPLGMLGLYAWQRPIKPKGRRGQKISQSDPDRESLRWSAGAHVATEQLHDVAEAIHVMDREGDSYELMAELLEHDEQFVIRICHDRRLDSNKRAHDVEKLYNVLSQAPLLLSRKVILSGRASKSTDGFPRRTADRLPRQANLEIRAKTIEFFSGNGAPVHLPNALTLNFVEVTEPSPPRNEEPILWRLVTTLPIDTAEQVANIVDNYRARWLIEEFFKAVKSGCKYQSLQLESTHGLMVALAIYSAVAWRLLKLRFMQRHADNSSATTVLTEAQMSMLRYARIQQKRSPLPPNPTASEVILAIAGIGGHLKRNGSPGWSSIQIGFQKLLQGEFGWWAAKEM